MHVAYVINGLGYGGGEHMLLSLLGRPELRGRAEVFLVSRGGPLLAQVRAMGVPVHRLRRGLVPRPGAWRRLSELVRSGALLHTHFFYSDLVGWSMKRAYPATRWVCTRHEMGEWMGPCLRRVDAHVLSDADRVVCVSDAIALALRAKAAARTEVIPPGILVPPHARRQPEPGRVLAVGRLEPVKGHDLLIDAMALLRARGRRFMLEIVGGGSSRRELEQRVRSAGLEQVVSFVGAAPRERVQQALRRCAVFVQPSRSEGTPLALLEAMASGAPVVATRVGGVTHLVQHGVTGRLCDANAESLAQVVDAALREPRISQRMARAARRAVQDGYELQKVEDALLRVYGELGAS